MSFMKRKKQPVKDSKGGTYEIAPHEIPAVRISAAVGNKCNDQLCFVVGGGLGDRVCAEPTLRFALEKFRGVEISLICETPELFRHLKFKEVFDLKTKHPIVGRHLYLYTYSKSPLYNQFMNANLCHCIDVASLTSLRLQLPLEYRTVQLQSPNITSASHPVLSALHEPKCVLLHLGKSWPSRTFPATWWEGVMTGLIENDFHPILIGNNCIEVALDERNSWEYTDLRNLLSLDEFLFACLNCKNLVTNDSSPLHIASAGYANIAFVSTCRRGDLVTHQRTDKYKYASRRDFAVGEMWNEYNIIPNNLDLLTMSDLPSGKKIEDYLPDPGEIVTWMCNDWKWEA